LYDFSGGAPGILYDGSFLLSFSGLGCAACALLFAADPTIDAAPCCFATLALTNARASAAVAS
jgi:hypothetical protein